MKKSFYCLWILLITILADDDLYPVYMDQAYLNITNQNHSQPIIVKHNLIVCEKCNYEILAGPLSEKGNKLTLINSRYAHEFELVINATNEVISCEGNPHKFSEGGIYSFDIIRTNDNRSSCGFKPQRDPGAFRYWLPVIIGFGLLFIMILLTQIWHRASQNPRFTRLLPVALRPTSIADDVTISLPRPLGLIANEDNNDIINTLMSGGDLTLAGANNSMLSNPLRLTKVAPKRLRSLDAFRGFSLMMMIFVNYGGGGYWFFNHSVWNGLTLADVVFPWFTWMMGVSIVLSQRSLRAKNVRKTTIFFKICRRTVTLFVLGIILQGGWNRFIFIRIFGVLQHLALCYFFAAILVLVFDDEEDEPYRDQRATADDVRQPLRNELRHTVFHFWPQWLSITLITLTWILITFLPKFEDCPRGYLGPGGKHDHGAYVNCTGGIAGYIDRKFLQPSHMDNHPTCKDIYDTQVPYDPEGLLGVLTGTLLCYLGVHAGHSFAHSTSIGRVCGHWLISSLLCGTIGLILSKGGQSDGWIPINKNLWSLSFILVLAALAYLILTILYLLVDVSKWFTGEPFLWLGMNSIVTYVGHEVCSKTFPIQFQVEQTTHGQLIAMHLYGVLFWTIITGLMYRKKFFIAI